VHEKIYRFLVAYAYRSRRCRNSTIVFSFPEQLWRFKKIKASRERRDHASANPTSL
jgi:hypothetical protein